MRKRTAFGFLVFASSGTLLSACLETSSTCEEHLQSCGNSGAAGSAGAGTSGSDSGASGRSGAGGDSGHGGSANGGRAGTSGAAGGGSGDSGAAGQGGTPCDATKSPSEEACLISNDYAIFVAPTGKDGASGSKSGPVKTIAKAIELAGDAKIVIACDGTYDEQLTISAGAKIYGGFSCPKSAIPWSYESGKKAKVAPSTKGIALSITAGAAAVAIEDFEFDAKDGVDPSESSIAGFVKNSTAVALTRVKLVAGKGADGANGTLTKVTKFPTQLELNGHAAAGNTGGDLNTQNCLASGSTTGASGGNGGTGALTSGGTGAPDLGMGKGGVAGSCSPNGTGQDGANAPPTPPALGAAKLGAITLAGWVGVAGGDGTPGGPGQGGGGGAGSATSGGGGGGGGGAGGCGGAGGTGGKAGGSSIALLLFNSTAELTANEFVAGNAGKGGSGVVGQDGQPEFGNGGLHVPPACPGGAGGKGASGGAGGGAAGGISVGIAYQVMQDMTLPTPDAATTITTGLAGAAGIGGVPGTNDGIGGVKQDVLQVP